MWKVVFETLEAEKEVEALIKSKKLSEEDQFIIDSWIKKISLEGPESIRKTAYWADHALEQEWEGYRASAFSNKGRIIYKVKDRTVTILIARITDKHDYKRKK